MNNLSVIKKIFKITKTIAVVGLSPQPYKPSHYVSEYLQSVGYKIIPVYPKDNDKILGEKVYTDLKNIPEKVDTVLIFRRPEYVVPYIKDAIEIGAKCVWLQEGIINLEAEKLALSNNLFFVMNKCMYKEHIGL